MTLSLNPTLTQEKQQENKEIQVNNIDIVTQHKPMPTQQENNTESSINTQEPIEQTPNTTQDFDINNKEYQEFVKEFLTTKQTAKDHYDLKYSKDLLKQSTDKFEITQLANPLFIANNIKDMGREGIEFFNKTGDQIKKSETELYDYLAKTGINHEMLGIKNFDEQKLKDAHTRQGLRGKTEYKQLNEEEKDYLKRQQNWAGALWDKMVNSEEKRVEELLRNDTRRYIDPDLLTDLIKIDSAYSSVLNVMKSSETATQDLQKKLKEMDIKAKERGYAAAVYDKKAKALAIIDKQGKKYYLDEDGVTANLDKIIVNNWNDILLSSIPGAGWGAKGAGIALKNAGFKGLGKEAAKAGAISFAASPLDYVTLRNEVGGEIDTKQMLEFSAGNALGSAAGVMAIGTLAKGASKAYNSVKDLKNLSTDDLKNIKISKYLDNEEASIHRKLAKFNKSEIDSNYEIFKGLQSDRVISKEMKDPTFMGNFMDKISDYNVLKHLSSKKESQDKLLSALFSNKELAREFAGKLTSEEATIVNKAIHAMGENFTRLSKEYEQQIIDEYAKSGKIKGLTPHTEMQNRHVAPKHETSNLYASKAVSTSSQRDNIESKSIQEVINIIETSPQKGRDMQIIGEANFTPQIIEYAHKNNKKIAIDKLSKTEAEQLGFKYADDVRVTIDYQAINHTLNRHGVESNLVKQSGQKPVEYSDIANYRNIAKTANETFFSKDDLGQDVILSFKQINGHAIIVESIRKKGNELAFKSMYFEKGSYKNSKAYKDVVESQKANHFQAPYGYEPHADANTPQIKADNHIIPQNLPEVYKHMLDEIDKQAKQDYKTSIDNLQNALSDTDFKATLLQGYKQVTDDAIDSLGLDNQLTNTLIRETQKLESKPNISLSEAIELRKNINEIMRNYEKSSSDLKKFRANKHLDNIKDNIDNAIKNALDSKVAQNEAKLNTNVSNIQALDSVSLSESKHLNKEVIETFIDSKGNTQEITKEVAQTWMNTFGLKSINDEAVANVAKEVRQAIGKDIKVNRKDLEKLIENHREQYIPQIKETFETPHVAFIDEKSDLLMGIPLDDKLFFVNVSRDYGKDFLNVTLSPKKNNNLLNKLQNAKQVIIDYPPNFGIPQPNQASTGFLSSTSMGSRHNPTQKTLTRQEADELFSNFQQANKNYAQIKESLNDKFAKALTKGMNKKDLDSRLTIEQWKQRVLDTQWGDSVKGLENTIFKNFNPRMQKHTQMLTILRALDRNVKLNDDSMPIDFTKILSDIENLEKLTLHPEIYPILDTFKSYAKSYQFAQEISKAKALENQVGGGALATTLEGRIKVFLTNRLFKKLFAFIPYVGDNAAITKALQSAIKDLKYPSEITLETLKVLNKADLDKGFKPIKDKENKPRFEYKANTPLNDAELQSQIKGNTQILNPKDTSEIEAIASNPLIQNMERQAKYNEELTQKISQFEANKENIQQDILNNLVVATQEIKQNTELLKQLAQQLTQNNPIHTPNKSIIKAEANNETYFITTDKNNITAIEKQEIQNLAQPKTYDELMQRDKNENATLESYRDQYADIAEIKEAQAQKQLLLEYKPEIKETSTSNDNTQINKDTDLLKNLYGNKQEMRKFVKDKLNAIKGKDIVNKDGIQARLSSVGIAKMSSDKAIQKSLDNGFKVEEHFEAVSNIENLFIQSKFFKSETPKNQSKDIKAVHRFIADNALKDKEAQALITLKESFQNGNRIYSLELEELTHPTNLNRSPKSKGVEDSHHDDVGATQTTRLFENHGNIIPQNPTKAQSEYFNPFMNEYEKIKEIKKLHTQDDNLIRVMKVEGRNDYIEPLSNMSVSKEYLQKQTDQSLKEQITQAILGNQTQLKALQQGYNTYHLSPFQKEILESVLDIANNPAKLKEYKLQGLQKQLDNLNNNEAYHIEKGREYDKARYAKDREELEKEIYALKGTESSTQINKDSVMLSGSETSHLNGNKDVLALPQHDKGINQYDKTKETFTDSYGKTHEIPKDIADNWKNTFNLKSLDEAYIPSFTPEVKQALDSILQGEDIKLYVGSLVKLIKENRLKYLDRIKPTLEQPQRIILQNDGALIFARNFGEEKYFTSVARNDNGEWIIRSNAPKAENGLNNKISAGGKEIYNSQAVNQINAHNPYDDIAKSNIKLDNTIIPQKLTERIKNDLDSNDYAEMLKSLKQLENKQAEIDTFTNETNLIRNTLEKQETEKYEKIVSPLFDKYPIMKEFYNERDINTHIYFKRFKNEFLERYNTQYDFFTLDEKAFLAKYPNFTQQDYKEATTQNLKALKDKNVSINEYVSFAKEYIDIVNNPVFEKMAKEIDSVDKKYWDTHFEMSEQRDSKVNEIIAILKKDIDSIDIANKADVSIDNFHKLGRYLAFMKQPEFGFANKLTFTKTGFFGKFLEQTDIKQRELLGELLSVEKLLEKEGKANRVLQDRLFTIFRLMRGEELLDREIKDVPLARELIEKQLNIKPIKEFGTNYAEHYHSGETAIAKLINEAQAHKESGVKGEYKGQVAGAFYRKELGDIDLVWGEVTGKGKEAKGYGLAKIIEKHLNAGDFKAFGEGEAGLINAMSEIIDKGKVITQNGVSTIWYKKDENIYKLGISKGFHKKGDNNWIVTSYKAEREKDKTFGDALFTDKHPLPNSSYILPQNPKQNKPLYFKTTKR